MSTADPLKRGVADLIIDERGLIDHLASAGYAEISDIRQINFVWHANVTIGGRITPVIVYQNGFIKVVNEWRPDQGI